MVRGDQFYMAVCNKTGTIAVYNENKNLFLSPISDGPLKFVGNLNNEKNIVQKSIYGKDFSIVKVPYAFKLLMQELKTMNVQMRLITEDSIDKLLVTYREEKELSVPKVNQPLRIALTGSTQSPSLGMTLSLFEKEEAISRIQKLINFI